MTTCTVSDYWSLFKKQGGRNFSLLNYSTHSVSPAALCSPGLNSPPLHKGHSWSMMLWDHAGPSCAAAHRHQSDAIGQGPWESSGIHHHVSPPSPSPFPGCFLQPRPSPSSFWTLSLFPLLSLESTSIWLHLFSPDVRSVRSKDLKAKPQWSSFQLVVLSHAPASLGQYWNLKFQEAFKRKPQPREGGSQNSEVSCWVRSD